MVGFTKEVLLAWFHDSESEIVKTNMVRWSRVSTVKLTKGKRNMENADGYETDKEENVYSEPRKKKVKRNKDISVKSTPEQTLHPPLQICFDEEIEIYLAGSESDDDQSVDDKSELERSDFSNESDVESDSNNDWMS